MWHIYLDYLHYATNFEINKIGSINWTIRDFYNVISFYNYLYYPCGTDYIRILIELNYSNNLLKFILDYFIFFQNYWKFSNLLKNTQFPKKQIWKILGILQKYWVILQKFWDTQTKSTGYSK